MAEHIANRRKGEHNHGHGAAARVGEGDTAGACAPVGVSAQAVRRLAWGRYRAVFAGLPEPQALPPSGDFRSEFIGPGWLRATAGPSLALTGLWGWCGKRFAGAGAVNLVVRQQGLRETLPMQPRIEPSSIDGRLAVRLHYPAGSGWPWRWMIDELRPLDGAVPGGAWLGMMHLELPGLRRLHFPFMLRGARP